jgi:uridine kinase
MSGEGGPGRGVRIVGVAGGSGSGKTTIVARMTEIAREYALVAQDNYYKSAEHITNLTITGFNFDHPDAFDSDLLCEHLAALKAGRAIRMPQYDFVHHRRREDTVTVEPRRLVILEGIMIFVDRRVRDLVDLKLYVDTPDDVRFIRRLRRDISERGRTVDSVIEQWTEKVRPGHYEFVEPTKMYADLVVPEGGLNERAMEVMVPFLRQFAG